MKTRNALLILALTLSCAAYGQRIQTVVGSFIYPIPEGESAEEARHKALQFAQIKLLADTFGTTVSSSSMMRTKDGDEHYLSIGQTEVKGEWLETIGEPEYIPSVVNGNFVLTVKVKGRVREITETSADIRISVLRNGTENRFESDSFINGDCLYLKFRTPVKGFLLAFMFDGERVQRLLPHPGQESESVPVKPGQDYVFFSENDEYTCRTYTSSNMEIDRLYVVFSTKPFSGPIMDLPTETHLPEQVSFKDFQKWLSRIRSRSNSVTVKECDITISSNHF